MVLSDITISPISCDELKTQKKYQTRSNFILYGFTCTIGNQCLFKLTLETPILGQAHPLLYSHNKSSLIHPIFAFVDADTMHSPT